jgi:hypothetical protein
MYWLTYVDFDEWWQWRLFPWILVFPVASLINILPVGMLHSNTIRGADGLLYVLNAYKFCDMPASA